MIGKNTLGYILGGSSGRDWGREINNYYRDHTAFIYFWTNAANNSIRLRNLNFDQAMYVHVNAGPTYGAGHDMHFSDNCNATTNSFCNIGNGFRNVRDTTGSGPVGTLLFGVNSYQFMMAEYEVFAIRYSPSSILSNSELGELQNLVKFNRFRLCYRQSRDFVDGPSFHERCNFMKFTLAVVRSEHGYVFGGYNYLAWQNRNGYGSGVGNDNFLFTLKNPYKTKLTFRQKNGGANAIFDHISYGPTFGSGHDMHVREYANQHRDSRMNPTEYDSNPLGIQQAKYVAGSNDNNYFVTEYEVYQVSGLFSTCLNTSQLHKNFTNMLNAVSGDVSRFEYQLLWRASETGFSNANFHQRVDGFANTLSIIKTTTGAVFGGFTTSTWNSNNAQYTDSRAFIYSFVNPSNTPIVMPVRNNGVNAIFTGNDRVLCYGISGACDIFIGDASNANNNSYANFGNDRFSFFFSISPNERYKIILLYCQ